MNRLFMIVLFCLGLFLMTSKATAQCSSGVCLAPQTGQPVRNTLRFAGRVGVTVLPPYQMVRRHFHQGGHFFYSKRLGCHPVRRAVFGRPYVFPRRYRIVVGSYGPMVTYSTSNYGVVIR